MNLKRYVGNSFESSIVTVALGFFFFAGDALILTNTQQTWEQSWAAIAELRESAVI